MEPALEAVPGFHEIGAQYNLAVCFFKGLGTKIDLMTAQKLAQQVATAGDERGVILGAAIAEEIKSAPSISITLTAEQGRELMQALADQQIEEIQQDMKQRAEDAAKQAAPPPPVIELSPLDRLKAEAAKGNVDAQDA